MHRLRQAIRNAIRSLVRRRKNQLSQGPTPHQEELLEEVPIIDNTFTQWARDYLEQGGDFMVAWVMMQEQLTPTQAAEKLKQRRAYRAKQLQTYRIMHTDLKRRFLGQYVAIHDGELVDYDPDRLALLRRVRRKYGRQVLITLVKDDAES